MRQLLFVLLIMLPLLCASTPMLHLGNWVQLVPSQGLPAGMEVRRANNNLDITYFAGRYYFAFRTAPTHFASRNTSIQVLSSVDRQNWVLEQSIWMGTDLREPRFAVHNNYLFLYFFQGGTSPLGFEPQHVFATQYSNKGHWTACQDLGLDGYVPWRVRAHNGLLYLSAYYGKGLYTNGHTADLRLFSSKDGWMWQPISSKPQVSGKGAEEGEFIFDQQGNLWATVRVEGGGGMLVFAHADSLDNWHCYPTQEKYDSALLFKDKEEIYLVSRRNVDGNADKGKKLPPGLARYYNLVRYSATLKTTAIWRIDKQSRNVVHLMDIGGTGDTAFPGIVELGEGRWWLLNYSSKIDGPKKSWIRGQLGKTFIYAAELQAN